MDRSRSLSTELSTPKTQYHQGFPRLIHNFTAPTTTTIYNNIYSLSGVEENEIQSGSDKTR